MAELSFKAALNRGVWFIVGGLPEGIEGTIAVTEDQGDLLTVGKLKDGVNVTITKSDKQILKRAGIKISPKSKSLIAIKDLDYSSEPLDIPMNLKPSKRDRIAQLMCWQDI